MKSLLTGMGTSMKVFCQKKVTEQYPENRHTTLHIPERHRALLTMPTDEEGNHKCIACGLCQMNCPNGTIKLTTEMRETEEGKKKKVLVKYEYNLGSCMFCMLCVNVCPHDAIKFTNEKRRVRKRKARADTQQEINEELRIKNEELKNRR